MIYKYISVDFFYVIFRGQQQISLLALSSLGSEIFSLFFFNEQKTELNNKLCSFFLSVFEKSELNLFYKTPFLKINDKFLQLF